MLRKRKSALCNASKLHCKRTRPLTSFRLGSNARRRFLAKVCGRLPRSTDVFSAENQCVFWTGAVRSERLGKSGGLVFGREKRLACEVAAVIVYGSVPVTAKRLRKASCHNPRCIHPHHNYVFASTEVNAKS
jgi:hypothetical protein